MEQESMSWVQPLVTLATSGGFAALVWYLVIKHIPGIEDRHLKERAEWLAYVSKRDEEISSLTRECLSAISKVNNKLEALEK